MALSNFQLFLSNSSLFFEAIAAIIALLNYKSVKGQYWKYFAYYLVIIFLSEVIGKWGMDWIKFSDPVIENIKKAIYYNYLVIPLQFIFFYWLYGIKSLKNNQLFWVFSILFVLSFIPNELYFKESKIVSSFNYTFGCLLLMIMVVMEYYKQINSDDIISFQKNKMFYINLGVTLFYIGTLPFFTFYLLLYEENREIWDIYYSYYQISLIIMYALFSISFVWGKQNS
ncbi:hypothetical protein [uncultured Chryseobacterium sp.]|uniref:hypothetical protein n=1 Tax=uncultured Chryseobacterium sp. TaxID=259322 RepID=UPI00260FBB3B|nr:hypothetical protein [uncultured Chryseobacterium sp.]